MFKTQVSLLVLASIMASFVQPAYADKTKRDELEDPNPSPHKKANEGSKHRASGEEKAPQENHDESDLDKLPNEIQQYIFALALGNRGSQARQTYRSLKMVDRKRSELASDDLHVLRLALSLSEPLYPFENWKFSEQGGPDVSWIRFMFDTVNQIEETSLRSQALNTAKILLKGLERNPESPILLYYLALTSLAAHPHNAHPNNTPLSVLLHYPQFAHVRSPVVLENTRKAKQYFSQALLADRKQKKTFDTLKYKAYLTLHRASSVGKTNNPDPLEAEIDEMETLTLSGKYKELNKFNREQIRIFALLRPNATFQQTKLLEASALLGDSESQFLLANYYLTGKGCFGPLSPDRGPCPSIKPQLRDSLTWWVSISEDKHHPHYREALYQRGAFYWPYGSPDREGAIPKNPKTSLKFLTKAAELGHPVAQKRLIEVYSGGTEEIKKDDELASKWLIKSAQQGSPEASYRLANEFFSEENRDEAIRWLIKAAQGGHTQAMSDLSKRYSSGSGVTQDEEEAIYWLACCAQKGDAQAAYDLARFYSEKDERKTIRWLIQAMTNKHEEAENLLTEIAAKGNIEAKFRLGFFLISRPFVKGKTIPESYQKGLDLVTEAAHLGFPAAMRELGGIFSEGKVKVEKNIYEGANWLLKAVERGDTVAVQKLTSLIETSHHLFENNPSGKFILGKYFFSCLKDKGRGVDFVLSAAYTGLRAAECYISKCCLEGNQVEKNVAKAVSWFLSSKMDDCEEEKELARQIVLELEALAEVGDNTSQFALSRFYLEGYGVAVDKSRGLFWLQAAVRNGHEEAKAQLDKMISAGSQGYQEDDNVYTEIMNMEEDENFYPGIVNMEEDNDSF
ncbi:MAG: hypothetical protein BGO67_04305 [Alphaproteobacteria bacterium 41-28]|nr:MAG: hypothetical protein BGO67_04305 [Alphaproteobacteria bacterium 41-28]